jgi:hypothetical protein
MQHVTQAVTTYVIHALMQASAIEHGSRAPWLDSLAPYPIATTLSAYSVSDYASGDGGLVFDQLPWFEVAGKLEVEKAALIEDRRRFADLLVAQEVQPALLSSLSDGWPKAIFCVACLATVSTTIAASLPLVRAASASSPS